MKECVKKYTEIQENYPHLFDNSKVGDTGILIVKGLSEIEEVTAAVQKKLRSKGQILEWGYPGIAYQDQYITILRDPVRFMPGKEPGMYLRQVSLDNRVRGAVMLAMTEGRILLVCVFRHGLRSFTTELPRGFSSAEDATSAACAERELKEETGYIAKPDTLRFIGSMCPNSGLEGYLVDLYCCEAVKSHDFIQNEGIERLLFKTPSELEEMIQAGTITDSFTITAFSIAQLKGMICDG